MGGDGGALCNAALRLLAAAAIMWLKLCCCGFSMGDDWAGGPDAELGGPGAGPEPGAEPDEVWVARRSQDGHMVSVAAGRGM